MKIFKTVTFILAIGFSFIIQAQEAETDNKAPVDKKSYYEKRAAEDAKYEQQFVSKNKEDEETFWDDQKAYEKDLKKKDRKAYRAYMQGKKDAYAEHYDHCNHHCHHSEYYYHHASFYYYRYDGYYYDRYPKRGTSVRTNVRLSTPRVRVGLGL